MHLVQSHKIVAGAHERCVVKPWCARFTTILSKSRTLHISENKIEGQIWFPTKPWESHWDNETSVLLQNFSFPDSFPSEKKILMPFIIADIGFLIFCQVVLLMQKLGNLRLQRLQFYKKRLSKSSVWPSGWERMQQRYLFNVTLLQIHYLIKQENM